MKYHIIKSDGTKVQLSDHQIQYAYFLAGFQNEANKGQLSKMYFDNGTVLGPVYDENGKTPIFPEYAGKEVRETNFLTR